MNLTITPGIIYEVLASTISRDSEPNIAPMGAVFDEGLRSFTLKPYLGTKTFKNLKDVGVGVLNLTRDPEAFVLGCLPRLKTKLLERLEPSRRVRAPRLRGAEAYIEFEVSSVAVEGGRAVITCKPLEIYLGEVRVEPLTRAVCALVEAAVSASRVKVFLGREAKLMELLREMERAGRVVERVAPEGRFRELMEALSSEVRRILSQPFSEESP